MPNFISASLTSTDKTNIHSNIAAIKAILTFMKNLTPKDRQKLFKMGHKSEGFVQGVLTVLKNQPAAAPSSFDVNEFDKDYKLYCDLRELWMDLISLTEGLEDTLLLLGSELMGQGTMGYKYIKQAAKGTMALDSTAAGLSGRFKQGKKLRPVAYTLMANEKVTLKGVVPKRLFKVLNQTAVLLYRGEAVTGEGRAAGHDTKFIIPSGWTTITIENKSDSMAFFSVLQK
jgi:hypothetical protein